MENCGMTRMSAVIAAVIVTLLLAVAGALAVAINGQEAAKPARPEQG
jgi:flagellar basal body-associated protein FliL